MFVPLKIPVYSCEFNSIEKVWSFAKTQWKKQMLMDRTKDIVSKEQLSAQVQSLLNNLDKSKVQNLFGANRAYLYATLQEAAKAEADAAAAKASQEERKEAAPGRRREQAAANGNSQ